MNFMHDMHADVFISFKNSDFSGAPTRDSQIARALYDELTSRNISTFYSNSTLLSLGQSVYKKSIDEALDTTKVLVVIASCTEYLNSEWVKYEWESFHHDILSSMKKNAQIVPYFGSFTQEEYDRWRYRYPEFDTTQRWAKVPSQALSDMLVEAFKTDTEE